MDLKEILKEIFEKKSENNVFYKKEVVAVDTETDNQNRLTNVSLYSRTKKGELCRVFTRDGLNDIYFFDLIDDCLVVFFQEEFDLRVIFNFFNINVVSREILVSSKQRIILSKFKVNVRNHEYSFYSYDLRNIFNCKLNDVSKMIIEYFRIKDIKREYYVNHGEYILKSDDLRKGITINDVHYDNALDIIKELKKKYGEDYYKSSEFLLYAMKDAIITFEGFTYYPHIFSEILKMHCERKMTISSLAFNLYSKKCEEVTKKKVLENHLYSRTFYKIINKKKGLKCKTINGYVYVAKPVVFSFLRKGYNGGLTYIREPNIFKDIVCFDINSAYPYALSIISPNIYSKIFRINLKKISEREKMFFDDADMYYEYTKFNESNIYYKTNPKKLKNAFNFTRQQLKESSDDKTILEKLCSYINIDIQNLRICKKYKYFTELIKLALKGRVVGVICGILKSIDQNSLGMSVNIKYYYPANVYGNNINKFVVMNFYDVIRLNADIEVYDILLIFNNDRELGNFIKEVYDQRVMYKQNKNSFENAVKLFLNSIYGKFGSMNTLLKKISFNYDFEAVLHLLNFDEQKNNIAFNKLTHKVLDFDIPFYDDKDNKKKVNILIKEFNGNTVLFMTEKKNIIQDYNVIFASSITAFVRLLLELYYRYFNKKYEAILLYSDTDSLHLKIKKELLNDIKNDVFVHNTNLGYLKYEGYFVDGYYVKRKCYILFDEKGQPKVKFKGSSKIRKLERERLIEAFMQLINKKAIMLKDLRYARLFSGVLFDEFTRYVYPTFEFGVSDFHEYRSRAMDYIKKGSKILENLRKNAYKL